MAVERNDFHQSAPSIIVVADGGRYKRSHKHSYCTKSGVAIIFGQKTRNAAVPSSMEQVLFCVYNCRE